MKRIFKLLPIKVFYKNGNSEIRYAETVKEEKYEIDARGEFNNLLKERDLTEIKSIEISYELVLRVEPDEGKNQWKIINYSIDKGELFRSFVVVENSNFLKKFDEELKKEIRIRFSYSNQ